MKVNYKDCEINVHRDKCMGGWIMLYYSAFASDGYEITSGFSEGEDSVRDWIDNLKEEVDEYVKDPEGWRKNNE